MEKATIFFDMDGVLAKWNEQASIEETAQRGYFLQREPEEKMIRVVKRISENFDVNILSSVYQDDHSIKEKIEWLQKVGLEGIGQIFVPYGDNKADYIQPGYNFLVDDFTKNLREFERIPGNFGIKFYNGINGTKGSWDGFRIDHRMSEERLYATIAGIVRCA